MDIGRGEERVSCMERVTWKLTLPYVNRNQMGICVWLRKLKQGHCINLGGMGGGWEGGSKVRGYMYTYG